MTVLDSAYQIKAGSGKIIAVSSAEATATVKMAKLYLITTNTDCYVRFSASAVAGTAGNFDIFLPAGGAMVLRATHTTIRAIRASVDGTLGISEVESV